MSRSRLFSWIGRGLRLRKWESVPVSASAAAAQAARVMRLVAIVAVLSAIGSGCAYFVATPPDVRRLDGFPLRRFDRVDAAIYRSGQPSAAQLQELSRRYGIRTVLKLNQGAEPVPAGVTVIHRPLSVMQEPSAGELREILEAIERSPKPLLVHCTHGEDRTGLVVALYRLRHGASTELAYADMLRHGFHQYPGVFAAWLHGAGWGLF